MQTTALEDYVIVAALSRLSYEFEDIDPGVSRIAWDLAVAIAGEYGLVPSEVVRLLEYYPGLEEECKAMVPLKQVCIPIKGK